MSIVIISMPWTMFNAIIYRIESCAVSGVCSMLLDFAPFCPPFVAFYPHFAFQSALRAAGASRDPAPKERDRKLAHRRAAEATRGVASHSELPKMVGMISAYIVYDKIGGIMRMSPEAGLFLIA